MSTPNLAIRRSRLGLIGLAALFFVPLALSFYLYYGTSWRPSRGAENGELISPARPLPEVSLVRADGGPTGAEFLRGDWHLVHVGSGSCDAGCRESLVKSRQVRLALDRDVNRVSRVFLFYGVLADAGYLAGEHPDLVSVSVDGDEGARLLAVFRGGATASAAGRLYIIDPLGNLMMGYPADTPHQAILTDLERLLRLSHIG